MVTKKKARKSAPRKAPKKASRQAKTRATAAPPATAAAPDTSTEAELWQANNKACQTLFSVLKLLAQITPMSFFQPTGARTLQSLPYLLPDASGQMVAARARMLALQLDAMFRHFEASYQDSSLENAIEALTAVLRDGENTVARLAAAADRHYLFFKENA